MCLKHIAGFILQMAVMNRSCAQSFIPLSDDDHIYGTRG